MESSTQKRLRRIVVFSDSEAERNELVTGLSGMSEYRVEAHAMGVLLDRRVDPEVADVVIADLGDGSVLDHDAIFASRRGFQSVPLILVGTALDPERIRRVMRLEAGDLLMKPVEPRKLIDAVAQQLGARSGGAGQVTAVVSAAGGSGGTSMAISIAEKLTRGAGKSHYNTCLVDLDFSSGSCGWYLDALSDYDLAEIIHDPNRVDAEFLDIIRKEIEAGFAVYSFQRPELAYQQRGRDLVLRMLDILSFQYRNVVVDVPYWDGPWKWSVLEAVNDVLIVTVATIPALKQARELYERLARARGTSRGLTIVVNRFRRRMFSKALARSEVERVFKDRPISFITEDNETMIEAVNRGVVPSEINRRSGFVKQSGRALDDHRKRMSEGARA